MSAVLFTRALLGLSSDTTPSLSLFQLTVFWRAALQLQRVWRTARISTVLIYILLLTMEEI